MTYSFNLIDQKWIPCVHLDGHIEEYSLRDTLIQAHTLKNIQGEVPPETAVMYRLLLAVLHSALRGPRDRSEWDALWSKGILDPEFIENYLKNWYGCFDLFHPQKPFYQFKDEKMAKKPAVYLMHGMGTANEMFEHSTVTEDVTLSCSQAARKLLVAQSYGLGGLCHPQLKITLTTAPLTRGIIFLVEGKNLFEILILNLLKYKKDEPLPTLGIDKPVWEMDNPFIPKREKPSGYLDYLTWQNRKLLLLPEDDQGKIVIRQFFIARGLDLKDIQDPMKQYRKTDRGWKQWVFTEGRDLWRDSHTLFRLNSPDENKPPEVFNWLSGFIGESLDTYSIYRCMALGACVHYKDAKIFFYRHENMIIPFAFLHGEKSEELVEKLTDALDFAEKTRESLWVAVNTLAKFIIYANNDLRNSLQPDPNNVGKLTANWSIERFYWSQLETPFQTFLVTLPQKPEAYETWKEIVQQSAWDALEQAINLAGEGKRILKAAVKARGILGNLLKGPDKENASPK